MKQLIYLLVLIVSAPAVQALPVNDFVDHREVVLTFPFKGEALQARFFAKKVKWIVKGRSIQVEHPENRAPYSYIRYAPKQVETFCDALGFPYGSVMETKYAAAIGNYIPPQVYDLRRNTVTEANQPVITVLRCSMVQEDL